MVDADEDSVWATELSKEPVRDALAGPVTLGADRRRHFERLCIRLSREYAKARQRLRRGSGTGVVDPDVFGERHRGASEIDSFGANAGISSAGTVRARYASNSSCLGCPNTILYSTSECRSALNRSTSRLNG